MPSKPCIGRCAANFNRQIGLQSLRHCTHLFRRCESACQKSGWRTQPRFRLSNAAIPRGADVGCRWLYAHTFALNTYIPIRICLSLKCIQIRTASQHIFIYNAIFDPETVYSAFSYFS